jgi:Domain of unknown function (DUF4397)
MVINTDKIYLIMKTHKTTPKSLLAKIGAACLISIALSSCLKDNNTYYNPPVALVSVIQASPDEPALDFFLESTKVNLSSIAYNSGVDYFKANAGKRTLNFYATGTTTKAFSDTATFQANYIYSVFLANKATSPELVILRDSISQPTGNNASIRFINLSPDAPAVDFAIKGASTVITSKKAYKGFSSFTSIAGNSSYTFQVLQSGTNTVLTSMAPITLQAGSVYTFWFTGLATPTNATDGLSLNIMTNASY